MSEKHSSQVLEDHVSGQANIPMTRPAHSLDSRQLINELRTDEKNGLTAAEAQARLAQYGLNDLGKEKGVQPLEIFIAQVVNAMTLASHVLFLLDTCKLSNLDPKTGALACPSCLLWYQGMD